jgi:hypothetical protein
MDKSSGDDDPEYTKIGDKQYHHFTVSLSDEVNEMTVTLDADDGYDMNLYLAKNTFALADRAEYADTSEGADKTLTVSSLEPGTWYVGVECATTVSAEKKEYGYEYSGKLEVLNGVEYSIKADWGEGTAIRTRSNSAIATHNRLSVKSEGKKVSIQIETTRAYTLKIFDVKGRLRWQPERSQTTGKHTWQPENGGMYLVRLAFKKNVINKRFMVVR